MCFKKTQHLITEIYEEGRRSIKVWKFNITNDYCSKVTLPI